MKKNHLIDTLEVITIFDFPISENNHLIKLLIGIPFDSVNTVDSHLYWFYFTIYKKNHICSC
jgi:hypothetical protein